MSSSLTVSAWRLMTSNRYVIAFDLGALVFVAGANGADAFGAGLFAWLMLLPAMAAFLLTATAFGRASS